MTPSFSLYFLSAKHPFLLLGCHQKGHKKKILASLASADNGAGVAGDVYKSVKAALKIPSQSFNHISPYFCEGSCWCRSQSEGRNRRSWKGNSGLFSGMRYEGRGRYVLPRLSFAVV